MNTNIEFSTNALFLITAITFVGILILIFAIRWRLNKSSNESLSEKYKNRKRSSPTVGRSKYPDVDVFRLRSNFLLFGLAASLGLAIAAFNWTSYEKAIFIPDDALALEEDIDIEPPRSDVPPPPPPPPPPPSIKEVPDELFEEEDEVEFLDQSIEEDTEVSESFIPDAPKEVKKDVAPPPPPPPMPEPEVEEIFQIVEEMPRFAGCENEPAKAERKACADAKLMEFIYSNIKFPNIARENGITGTVVIRFYVDKDGSVKDITILKDIGGACGAEAQRVVELMNQQGAPVWIPGKQRGAPVKVWFNLPVKFKLV